MKTTKDLRLSDISSLYNDIDAKQNITPLIKELINGVTIDNNNAPEAFAMYNASYKALYRKAILTLLHDEKIIIKYNPDATLGNYFLFVPVISGNGAIKLFINVNYFTDLKDGKFRFKANEFEALLTEAYAMYTVMNNYGKIASNHGMRKAFADMYVKIVVQSLRGSSLFASPKNMNKLTYITVRFLYQHHFGMSANKAIEYASAQAKMNDIEQKAWVIELNARFPEDTDWDSLDAMVNILTNQFVALKDKTSVSSLRNNAGILLGAPSVLALDYVPYIAHMAMGQSNNYILFRSPIIKQEMGAEAVAIVNNVIIKL